MIKSSTAATEYYFREGCYITELSNSADDPSVSIARARVEPGVTTRWHYLLGACERYVIISGSGRVELGTEPPRQVGTNDVVIITEQCPQRITNTGSDQLIFLAICSPRFLPENYRDIDHKL